MKGDTPFHAHIEVAYTTFDLTLPIDDFAERYLAKWVDELLSATRAAPRPAVMKPPLGYDCAIETLDGMTCRLVRQYRPLNKEVLRIDLEYRPPVAAEATAEAA